ncbi:unnamed protein product [Euphydryas editha]|uniref:Uncharacterized protein n=1 Tax=Euphydryas editha TaxID=104508 RepID=A0AAU9U9A7_EUPED|nr:unnamed protein product [Euphydryas editha]
MQGDAHIHHAHYTHRTLLHTAHSLDGLDRDLTVGQMQGDAHIHHAHYTHRTLYTPHTRSTGSTATSPSGRCKVTRTYITRTIHTAHYTHRTLARRARPRPHRRADAR